MNRYLLLLIHIGICLLICSCQQAVPLSDSGVELTDYQKKVLNNLYVDIDEIHNRTEMYFSAYGIPTFDSGKVTVFNEEDGQYTPVVSLLLKDSMLVNFGHPKLQNPILYDDNGHILQLQKMNITYAGDKIKTSNNGVAQWVFEHEGNCIIRRYVSETSSYQGSKKYCYDQDKRLTDFEWYNNVDSSTVFEYFKYNEGFLIEKNHFKIKGLDTLFNQRTTTASVENGLIKKYQFRIDQVIARTDTSQQIYPFEQEYSLIKKAPLTILKKVHKFGELSEEIVFTFNENGHLTEYFTKGENRKKYRLEYEYEK